MEGHIATLLTIGDGRLANAVIGEAKGAALRDHDVRGLDISVYEGAHGDWVEVAIACLLRDPAMQERGRVREVRDNLPDRILTKWFMVLLVLKNQVVQGLRVIFGDDEVAPRGLIEARQDTARYSRVYLRPKEDGFLNDLAHLPGRLVDTGDELVRDLTPPLALRRVVSDPERPLSNWAPAVKLHFWDEECGYSSDG